MDNQTNQIVEQPINHENQEASDHDTIASINSAQDNGSTFGKFKDATSLLAAYNQLQAEFTRKSQKLSETVKELESFNNQATASSAREIVEGSNASQEQVMTENEHEQKKANWRQKVDVFFSQNPEAKSCAKSIANVLKSNVELMNIDNGIEIAYKLSKADSYREPADLIKDKSFIENHVLKSDEIKNAVIKAYLENASLSSGSPKTLGGYTGEHVFVSNQKNRPTTLAKAGEIFESMLNGK